MIKKPEMILIDVDGTLVDSVPDLAFCVDEMMKAIDREPWGEEKVRDWVGNGVERLVRRSLIGELNGERCLRDCVAKPMPGVSRLLLLAEHYQPVWL